MSSGISPLLIARVTVATYCLSDGAFHLYSHALALASGPTPFFEMTPAMLIPARILLSDREAIVERSYRWSDE
ncbi:hypothetical protein F3J14_04080 [Burkholderia sp. Tr-862]|uniref:hypothetical protein n=1 Tax=Burkholderia sp. Tr-862 TaxID=2608331 RepID=UPI00141A12F3|nr:hypothetical protein [Burkholderia sp. Tr-862]NIF40091.1 hypothetical protein [Burkholderia sp. Tr-862]